jgi:hypothetical protein
MNALTEFRGRLRQRRELFRWAAQGCPAPSPPFVKRSVLQRNGIAGATWIETGTFMGETTEYLSKIASKVISIEPEPNLYRSAVEKFRGQANVELHNGLSEDLFKKILPGLSGDVCFWLDGHFSSGVTYQGPKDTPILDELSHIQFNLKRLAKVVVLVDDMRCFDPSVINYKDYPGRSVLVDWARTMGMFWHIEHDIFICKNYSDIA